MLKLSHTTLIMISGFIWLAVGCFLLPLGLYLIAGSIQHAELSDVSKYPILHNLGPYLGGIEMVAIMLIAIGLYIGYLKGRYVLGKSAHKGITRIRSFPNPTNLSNMYSAKYYILLGAMIGLGLSIKYLGIPNDIRGAIDVAIGSALINGAVIYFRNAFSQQKIIT